MRRVEVSWAVGDVDVLVTFDVDFDASDRSYGVDLVAVEEDAQGAQPSAALLAAVERDARLGKLEDRAVRAAQDESEAEYEDAMESRRDR